MKPKFFLKGAVVAMAAFGAFAFNGNANAQQGFTRSDTCESISAECSNLNTGQTCMIEVNNNVIPVLDSNCFEEIKHDSQNPVEWSSN